MFGVPALRFQSDATSAPAVSIRDALTPKQIEDLNTKYCTPAGGDMAMQPFFLAVIQQDTKEIILAPLSALPKYIIRDPSGAVSLSNEVLIGFADTTNTKDHPGW